MPDTAPMGPPERTPVAVVQGPQTAVVVGDGEIDCDEYGRILVRFHWDLAGAYSIRCRVSQNWAGAGWGGMVIPRIGMEVIVEFLEGDPDKPIVTGDVFNGRNDPPYPLPEHKTKSVFRTNSHEASYYGFNELRFEDKADNEEIRIIAQKDMNTLIKNSEARIVMNDSATAIMDNHLLEVFGNSISSISGSVTTYVGATGAMGLGAQGMGVRSNLLSEMAHSLDRPSLKENGSPGDYTLITDGSYAETIGHSQITHINENAHLSVGASRSTSIDQNRSARIGGNDSTHVQGSVVEVTGKKHTIICGSSRIELNSDGRIIVRGTTIRFEGTEAIDLKSPQINMN